MDRTKTKPESNGFDRPFAFYVEATRQRTAVGKGRNSYIVIARGVGQQDATAFMKLQREVSGPNAVRNEEPRQALTVLRRKFVGEGEPFKIYALTKNAENLLRVVPRIGMVVGSEGVADSGARISQPKVHKEAVTTAEMTA